MPHTMTCHPQNEEASQAKFPLQMAFRTPLFSSLYLFLQTPSGFLGCDIREMPFLRTRRSQETSLTRTLGRSQPSASTL